jgi:hypothetical protein
MEFNSMICKDEMLKACVFPFQIVRWRFVPSTHAFEGASAPYAFQMPGLLI